MERLNILMVSPYFYPEGGGLEKYVYEVSKGLVEKGHKIVVLCSTKKWKTREEIIDGIKVVRQKPHLILSNTPIKIDLFFEISKLMKEDSFDLVNAHTPIPYYADVAALTSKIHRIPFVLTIHGLLKKDDLLLGLISWFYERSFIEKFTLRQAQKIIANSKFVRNHLASISKELFDKADIISPGVNINIFKPAKKGQWKRRNILFVGQLTKDLKMKGLTYLLESLVQVKEYFRDVSLSVVGSGDHVEFYKENCRDLKIESNVVFTGKLGLEKLRSQYQKSDVLVLPSYSDSEGFGKVLIEANACGKPVIGTKVGGIPYVIRDGETGLLVPPKDSKALANAIIKILSNEELAAKMGESGRKYVEEFDLEKTIDRTENVLLEFAKASRASSK